MKGNLLIVLVVALIMTSTFASHSTEEWKSRTVYQLLTDRFAKTDGSTNQCGDLKKY